MKKAQGLGALVKRDLAKNLNPTVDAGPGKNQKIVSAWRCKNGWIVRTTWGGVVEERVYMFPDGANEMIQFFAKCLDIEVAFREEFDPFEDDEEAGERISVGAKNG